MRRFAVVVVALAAGACANLPADNPPEQLAAMPTGGHVVGGYAPADQADPSVAAAEKLAVDEIYKREPQRSLVESVTREQQVVAGMNYRFTIKMSGMNSYRVVVLKPLPGQGEMKVTGFDKLSGN